MEAKHLRLGFGLAAFLKNQFKSAGIDALRFFISKGSF
jgi:hypothetical protein